MTVSDFFEVIHQQQSKALPFVAFRAPNSSTLKLYLQNDATLYETSTFTESGFVFAPFDLEQLPSVIIPFNTSTFYTVEFPQKATKTINKDEFTVGSNDDKATHLNLVKKGIAAIKNNTLQKVVLSREEVINASKDHAELFKRLLYQSTNYVYWFYHPKVGEWMGATPETLLRISNQQLTTMSLAGTKMKTDAWTEKEKEEQQIVTEYIVEALSANISECKLEPTETITAGNVEHLRTVIKANVVLDKKDSLKAIIESLHPTPAVCGFPKVVSKAFILDNENYKREYYTGFLGELNNQGSTQLFVNLRCMQLKHNQASVYVGGGILGNSNPEHEWEETIKKSYAMKSVMLG